MQMEDEVLREDEEAEISFHIIANIKIKKSDPDYKDFVEAMKTQNGEVLNRLLKLWSEYISFEDDSILGYLVPKNEIAATLPAHSQVIDHRGNQVFNYPFLLDNQNIVMNLLRNTADDARRSDEQEEAKA